MLDLKEISVRYQSHGKSIVGLDRVTISIPDSGIFFVVGRNGSGKSSLLDAIGGRIKYSGEISWRGRRLNSAVVDAVRWFPQFINAACPSSRTVEELIRSVGARTDILNSPIMEGVFPKEKFYDRQLGEFSGGQRQILVWLIAMSLSGDLLLFDETFQSIDLATRELIWEDLRSRVCASECLALIVSHDLDFVTSKRCSTLVVSRNSEIELLEGDVLDKATLHARLLA